MGKCVRIRSSSKPSPGEAAAYLTLRSGRRVPVAAAVAASAAACGSRRHRRRGSPTCRCSAKRSPVRRKSAEPRHQLAGGGDRRLPLPEAASPVARDDRGDSSCFEFEQGSAPTLLSGDAVKKVKKHERGSNGGVEDRAPSPLMEAEMEAFFAAAELAERQRFAEAYNYDIALDRPLEGRFEWTPVST